LIVPENAARVSEGSGARFGCGAGGPPKPGPIAWNGDSTWDADETTIRVPPTAREGILRIGLFGAIGEVSFDDIRFTATVKGQ
jgi:hypothetical protein